MTSERPFKMHVTLTQRYEFEVWAKDIDEARGKGRDKWCKSAAVGQWRIPDDITEYKLTRVRESFQFA